MFGTRKNQPGRAQLQIQRAPRDQETEPEISFRKNNEGRFGERDVLEEARSKNQEINPIIRDIGKSTYRFSLVTSRSHALN